MNAWDEKRMAEYLSSASSKAIGKAMLRLYERQTMDEREATETRYSNSVGFSACDAKSGTYFARWVFSGRELSGKYLERARKIALKYRGQLADIANLKAATEVSAE